MSAAAEQLAAGFAAQLVTWAARRGCDGATCEALHSAALAVCQAISEGHVCISIADSPSLGPMRERLAQSGLVGTAAQPAGLPLIMDEAGRLYLHRYFDDERRLAGRLVRAAHCAPGAASAAALDTLAALFASPPGAAAAGLGQRLAVEHALQSRLTIISGGPGTGKTTTVAKLIACLLAGQAGLRIVLCAPTGKARARLVETMQQRAASLPAAVRAQLPQEAYTIHRLLGMRPGGRALYHAGNPLPLDVLVVDEASMLDLALAARLFDALPLHARVVLLGDKNQLAAVESGAIFAELCRNDGEALLAGSVVALGENFRFGAGSRIGRLAAQVCAGDSAAALATLRSAEDGALRWIEEPGRLPGPALQQALLESFEAYFAAVASDPWQHGALIAAFGACRVLCAVRDGPRGVSGLNERIETVARARLQALAESLGVDARSPWYPGRAVMVTQNDYASGLMNGDVGIVLPDANRQLRLYFGAPDGGVRALALASLPSHETAFATTVHKAQGSEFDEVLLVLPEAPGPLVTRELLYTAVTRARMRVTVCAGQGVLGAAIAAPTRRRSGLATRLRESAAALPRDILAQ